MAKKNPVVIPHLTKIECDNDKCKSNKKGVCSSESVVLIKTWTGSEDYYRLKCTTASDFIDR